MSKRRSLLKNAMLLPLAAAGSAIGETREPKPQPAGLGKAKITKVRAIITAPYGTNLVVVKVETDQPGLYGVGCATFTQRAHAVVSAVND